MHVDAEAVKWFREQVSPNSSNWLVCNLRSNPSLQLVLLAKGSGGLSQVAEAEVWDECKVQVALIWVTPTTGSQDRLVLITFCPEGAPPVQKANFPAIIAAAQVAFPGYHCHISARTMHDLTPASIADRLRPTGKIGEKIFKVYENPKRVDPSVHAAAEFHAKRAAENLPQSDVEESHEKNQERLDCHVDEDAHQIVMKEDASDNIKIDEQLYEAIYPFTADPDDTSSTAYLHLEAGDLIGDPEPTISEDWMRGTRMADGSSGLFPAAYVRPYNCGRRMARLLYPYHTDDGDVVALEAGQLVGNVEECEDGWCVATVNNNRLLIPRSYLEDLI